MNYMYSFCHVPLFFTQVKVRKVIDLLRDNSKLFRKKNYLLYLVNMGLKDLVFL